jgi:hypothetical protein
MTSISADLSSTRTIAKEQFGRLRALSISSRVAPRLLTPVVLLVHGYHPFAGDAGIYLAGVRHVLDPSLYPLNAQFATAFTRLSIFGWGLAGLVRVSHVSLEWVLFALFLLSIFLFLAACRELAAHLFPSEASRWSAELLAAAWFTLPVAGTALTLMDPYVTARSFSTPVALFAVVACLDCAWGRTTLLLVLAVLLHPLMGAYAAGFVILLGLVGDGRARAAVWVCAAAFTVCGAAFAFARHAPVSAAYRQAVGLAPRSFLFLARWRWYEVLGVVLPLLLFARALHRLGDSSRIGSVCVACLLTGSSSLLIAALFVPVSGPYLLVPLQILRGFHVIYSVGIVMCGGLLGAAVAQFRGVGRVFEGVGFVALFCVMFFVQRVSWPGSNAIQWPGMIPANPYEQAFLWIRKSTPRNAVFAFNPQLVYRPGEDEQGFRAIAERDQLADDKDGGVVAVVPRLADRWARQRNAEVSVDGMSDEQRLGALVPPGANWVLLAPDAQTRFTCPFRNAVAQVCRMW